jgi:hypothetical protein
MGLLGVGFSRFAIRSALVDVIYAPALLYVVVLYGDHMVPHLGWWAWIALLLVSLVGIGRPWARALRRTVAECVGLRHGEQRS